MSSHDCNHPVPISTSVNTCAHPSTHRRAIRKFPGLILQIWFTFGHRINTNTAPSAPWLERSLEVPLCKCVKRHLRHTLDLLHCVKTATPQIAFNFFLGGGGEEEVCGGAKFWQVGQLESCVGGARAHAVSGRVVMTERPIEITPRFRLFAPDWPPVPRTL